MKRSSFQFSNPVLTALDFRVNQDFVPKDEIEVKNEFEVKIAKKDETSEAVVLLIVSINHDLENAPFYCVGTIMANYKWDETIDESTADKFLNQNAPSLLLSYIRPIIANTIGASNFPAYNIPFMDFTMVKKNDSK